jgi:hypothetical protein
LVTHRHPWAGTSYTTTRSFSLPRATRFVFRTIEDEDALMNIIVRPDVYQRYYKVMRNCFLLIVEGTIQKQRGVLNVLAEGAAGM